MKFVIKGDHFSCCGFELGSEGTAEFWDGDGNNKCDNPKNKKDFDKCKAFLIFFPTNPH